MTRGTHDHLRSDLKGVRVGTETVVKPAGSDHHLGRIWLLRCDCGATRKWAALRINAALKRGKKGGCPDCWAPRGGARPTYDQRQVAKVFADLFAVLAPNPPKVQKARPFGKGSRSRHEGKVVAGWLVVREAGWQRIHGRLCRVWTCRCTGCGTESNKSTAILGVMHAKSPTDSAGCRRCADARRRVPDSERICQWCSRSTLGQKQPRECGACNRRAMRNGRDDEGRPIGRVSEKCREGQARRKAARVRVPGEKKAAS